MPNYHSYKSMSIYGLYDPRTSELRYVGFTSQPLQSRLKYGHLRTSELKLRTHKAHWISSLLRLGLKPEIFEIQKTDINNWKFDEQWNIEYFKSIGCRLTNATSGGDGTLGRKASPETRRKMSASGKTKTFSPSHRENLSLGHMGNKSNTGNTLSLEHKEKISRGVRVLNFKGHWNNKIFTQEHKTNIVKSMQRMRDISRNEMSIVDTLIKQNLAAKEISTILGVSIVSARKIKNGTSKIFKECRGQSDKL